VVTIDYALNDRGMGLDQARASWTGMIRLALDAGCKIILLTPTPDLTQEPTYQGSDRELLSSHAEQVRQLASEHGIGLADSFAAFRKYQDIAALSDLLSWTNHPNRQGHEIVASELLRWFQVR
jgi:hypothetical protein